MRKVVVSNKKPSCPFFFVFCPPISLIPMYHRIWTRWGDISVLPHPAKQAPSAEGACPIERNTRSWRLRSDSLARFSTTNTPLWLYVSLKDGWIVGPTYPLRRYQSIIFEPFPLSGPKFFKELASKISQLGPMERNYSLHRLTSPNQQYALWISENRVNPNR